MTRLSLRRAPALELTCVREPVQNRVVTGRSEIFDKTTENRIEQRTGMFDVEIERRKLAVEMEFWLVVERVAVVVLQTFFKCPGDDVAQCVKIKVQIERDVVIQYNAFVVKSVPADQTKTECDDLARLPPDEKPRPVGHLLSDYAKIIFRQRLEL